MDKTDLDKCSGFGFQDFKCRHGSLWKDAFSFPFPSLPFDYFDVQDINILLGII